MSLLMDLKAAVLNLHGKIFGIERLKGWLLSEDTQSYPCLTETLSPSSCTPWKEDTEKFREIWEEGRGRAIFSFFPSYSI